MSRSDVSSSHADDRTLLECTDCLEPADAFALVGDETRLAILEALWAADERPVSFSELRRAVGMRDSAQFNYHLQQLTGHFVRKVEETGTGGAGASGYEFKHAGEKIVRSILAGSFTESPTLDPFSVRGACVSCGGSLRARYADEQFTIECRDCEQRHGQYPFPPGGLNDRTREEVAEAFDHRVRHLHCLAADGVCPECNGRTNAEIVEGGECCLGIGLRVDNECEQCGHTLCSAVGLRLLDHSEVVSFHRERGVHLDERPYWTLPWCVSDRYTRVLERDPYRLEVRIPLAGDELHVELDDDLDVLETRVRTVE
ncbi:winged helix-turn-helix domain-containing protein [Natrarchaeobius chitinivorans]|uniref:ArsR family transcriptional regulator n=1 Tax=Natrarchaeobius chitinivorans TaxID=1679083 RepID=A0A3N6MHR4_NATCH|nr:helix-turn-helix domain-containing protein [Natrarchaeobius chitinivorans]RQG96450.1 ArsR family transcriptional regulator [Natrarchaeobius chitinivorans]